MPYGQAQSIGTGYNPAMGIYDYSGYVDASRTQAEGIANAAGIVAQGIDKYAATKQQDKELSATKKSTEMMIDSAINLYGDMIPGLKEQFTSVKAQMNDPSISLYEQAAIGKSMSATINDLLSMQVQRMQLDMQQQRLNQMNQRETAAQSVPSWDDWGGL